MSAGSPDPAPPDPAPWEEGFGAAQFQRETGATGDQVARIEKFRELLATWNTRMNLVGPSALAAFWGRHALDSAQLFHVKHEALLWADLGAGAGFPGVVLAILLQGRPGARVELVESMAKRCAFLTEVVTVLDLPTRVHHARAESLDLTVEVVTARACAPVDRLMDYAWPTLRRGATGLFLKGAGVEAELTAAAARWKIEAELLPSRSDPSGRILKVERLTRA